MKEAFEIDAKNGNTLWDDAIELEMKNNIVAFEEYDGKIEDLVAYEQISGHLIFGVKLSECCNIVLQFTNKQQGTAHRVVRYGTHTVVRYGTQLMSSTTHTVVTYLVMSMTGHGIYLFRVRTCHVQGYDCK